jgi:hypothetical protein
MKAIVMAVVEFRTGKSKMRLSRYMFQRVLG